MRSTTAILGGNGGIFDIPRRAIHDPSVTKLLDRQFEELKQRTGDINGGIGEILSDDHVVIEINGKKTEVPLKEIELGGNTLNTSIAAAESERSLTGESNVTIYGPMPELLERLLIERTRLKVHNTLQGDQRRAMPPRISIIDSEAEKYLRSTPEFEKRIQPGNDLNFLMEQGILVPKENGDLILSSCINSSLFWKQIETYLKRNPKAQLYFQPGSTHLGKLVNQETYLPENLMREGRITIILNVDELDGFLDNLESHDIRAKSGPARLGYNIHIGDCFNKVGKGKRKIARQLSKTLGERGLRDVVITNGPGKIVRLKTSGQTDNIYITKPKKRKDVEGILKDVGLTKSKNVLSTGCGDTFTGAFITLAKLFPHEDSNTLMELASLFGAIQTHNPSSNVSNLELRSLNELITKEVGQPRPTTIQYKETESSAA